MDTVGHLTFETLKSVTTERRSYGIVYFVSDHGLSPFKDHVYEIVQLFQKFFLESNDSNFFK